MKLCCLHVIYAVYMLCLHVIYSSLSLTKQANRHEELSDRSAAYADFGHGSLFEAAPGARQFVGTAESPTKSLFKPFNIHMYHSGLHVYIEGRGAIPSTAASGLNKSSGSGQRPSHGVI